MKSIGVLFLFLSVVGFACPDLGIELRGKGGNPLSDFETVLTGSEIRVNDGNTFRTFYFDKQKGPKGAWCWSFWLKSGEVKDCQKQTGQVLKMMSVKGQNLMVAILGTQKDPQELSLSEADLAAGFDGALVYLYPRFVFKYQFHSAEYADKYSTRESMAEALKRDKGIIDDEKAQYSLIHKMRAELVKQDGKAMGSVVLDKKEFPLGPQPKSGLDEEKPVVNLDGKNYESTPDSGGCHTEVREVGNVWKPRPE